MRVKTSTAQLRMISRSITARNQKKAITELAGMGIDFKLFSDICGYRGSPCRLLNDIKDNSERTIQKVELYWNEVKQMKEVLSDE